MDKSHIETFGAFRQRKWRASMTPEKREEYLAERRRKFAESGIDVQRALRKRNPGLTARYAKDAYGKNPTRAKRVQKEYRDRIKAEVISVYGGFCACCGEDEIAFLSLDHIEPLFRSQRTRGGSAWYQELLKAGYPPGLQVLCYNCNLAKGTGDECPHRLIVRGKLMLVNAPRDL